MARARDICQQLGEVPQLFPAIYGLRAFYLVGGQMHAAREIAEQLLRMAEAAADPILACGAHTAMGSSLHHLAELPGAHEHYERAIAVYDRRQHEAYRALYRQDIGPYTRCESLRVLWLLGYPDRALRRLHEA